LERSGCIHLAKSNRSYFNQFSRYKEYGCDNPGCRHIKYITNACHSRACPSCGKKATDLWIAAQLNRLPDCDWIHLVFTLPDSLWPLFEVNRWLLNDLCRLAVDNLLYAAGKRGLDIGIFCAIHTYGRGRLLARVHVKKDGRWQKHRKISGSLPEEAGIAGSRLAHYAGGATLSFSYHDHNTGEQATETLTQRDIVARLKQHIPEKFFRMVRYFGFLANRVCGEKLPRVYAALGMDKPAPVPKVCYAQMSRQFLRRDPFECILCGGHMVYRRAVAGLNVQGLKIHAREISLMRYIPA
jgi:hypothetical protein